MEPRETETERLAAELRQDMKDKASRRRSNMIAFAIVVLGLMLIYAAYGGPPR